MGNKDLTVEQIKAMKVELETEIRCKLQNFVKETNLEITGMEIGVGKRQRFGPPSDYKPYKDWVISKVNIEVKL